MYAAVCELLQNSSKLVHAICKGEEPKEGKSNTLSYVSVNCKLQEKDFVWKFSTHVRAGVG